MIVATGAESSKHDDVHLLVELHDFTGMLDAARPGHFGDVHQAFDAGFKFNEGAVGHDVDDLALDFAADGILCALATRDWASTVSCPG